MNMKKTVAWLTVLTMLCSMAATVLAVAKEEEEPVYELTFGGESVTSDENKGTLSDGAVEYTFADGTFVLTVKKAVNLTAPIETTASLVIRTQKGTLAVTADNAYAVKAANISLIKSSLVTFVALEKAIETEGSLYVGSAFEGSYDDGEEISDALAGENYFHYNGKAWEADTVTALDMFFGEKRIFVLQAEEDEHTVTLSIDDGVTLSYRMEDEQAKQAVLSLSKAQSTHIFVNTTGTGLPLSELTVAVKRDSRIASQDEEPAIVVNNADVLIKGAGTLTIRGKAGGILLSGGALTLSGNVDVILSKGFASPVGIDAEALWIEAGALYVDASQPKDGIAIKVSGNFDIDEEAEHLTAAGQGGALLSEGTVTVADKVIKDDLTDETYVEYTSGKALVHHAMKAYDVTVGGVSVTEINQDDVLRDGRISYKNTSSSMYFTGITLTGEGLVVNGGNGGSPLKSLTIRLAGDNRIDLEAAEAENAIYALDADVYIKGDGTLEINTVGTCIVVENGYMRFAGGDTVMNTSGNEGTVHAEKGIKLTDTEIIKGGSVKNYGDYYGFGTTKREAAESRIKPAEKSSSGSGGKASSSSGSGEKIVLTTYKVTFISYGQVVELKTVAAGEKVTPPEITMDGYVLDGWYTSEIGTEKIDVSQGISRTMTLYARWIPLENDEKQPLLVLTIDAAEATVSGERKALEASPFIERSRTYTPARFVAEALGATVQWDDDARRISITQ